MFNRDDDEDLYGHKDDDEKFYRETVYNEAHYIEQEQEFIRQSNLEIELEEIERKTVDEMEREAEEEREREEERAQAAREWEEFQKNHPAEAAEIVREANE